MNNDFLIPTSHWPWEGTRGSDNLKKAGAEAEATTRKTAKPNPALPRVANKCPPHLHCKTKLPKKHKATTTQTPEKKRHNNTKHNNS